MIPDVVLHYQPVTWRFPVVGPCRGSAMFVTDDLERVTCRRCQAGIAPMLRVSGRQVSWRDAQASTIPVAP